MPPLTLAIRAPLVGGARPVARELARRGNPALDLDLTPGSPARAALGVSPAQAFASLAPASIWLPERALSDASRTGFLAMPESWTIERPPLVAIDLPLLPEGRFVDFVQAAAAAERYRRETEGSIALALRARHLAGGRRHLAQMTLLRRSLEEWNLPVVLDLSGPFDPQWEAEAAVLRLAGRIAMVRIEAAALSPAAVDRARVARRAIRAALEIRPDLPVSIALPRQWWRVLPADNLAVWKDARTRVAAYRAEARHIEPPARGSRRSRNPSNPSGLI